MLSGYLGILLFTLSKFNDLTSMAVEQTKESQLVLRSNCNALIPITTTIAKLKASYDDENDSIKSSAVERTSDTQPVIFRSLQQNTNIALPPENWLKTSNHWEKAIKRFVSPHSTLPSSTAPPENLAQSIQLANAAVDILPYLDVVSTSENLKSLLKVPYDNEQILSLAIHRVGKTFLIDNFDAYSYLLDAQRADWHWIRKWFRDTDGERMALLLAASSNRCRAKSREKIRERDMLSKFLYYSIEENEYPISIPPSQSTSSRIFQPNDSSSVTSSANVAPNLFKPTFQKTAMWTLEDMKLLVGSDLPIFSTGNHPSFSLRLCDQKRPINVITGLDYWLDNLMCDVPEVLMCFHQDGIVQQYEVYKTEDLPNLSSECTFSPSVVKDFAKNILSFLRSNATKEGHTYWLLKEPDLDVVKLYDLTSLCEDFMDSVNDNPFALPLAVLLCRLAYSILERGDSTSEQFATVPKLLDSSLKLVDRTKYPWLNSIISYLQFTAATKRFLPDAQPQDLSSIVVANFESPEEASAEERSFMNLQYIANGLTFLLLNQENDLCGKSDLQVATAKNFPVQWTPGQQNTMVVKLLRGAVNCYLHVAAVAFDSLVASEGCVEKPQGTCLCISIRNSLRLARDCLAALRLKLNSPNCEQGLHSAILQAIGDLHFVAGERHKNCTVSLEEPARREEIIEGPNNLLEINRIVEDVCRMILTNRLHQGQDVDAVEQFIGPLGGSVLHWPQWSSAVDRIESAIQVYRLAFEASDDRAAVVRRVGNACVEFANAIIAKSLELFSNDESTEEPLEELWKKAYFAFDKAALLFETVQPVDRNNLAVVESNRARLMRVCAYCQPKSVVHYLSEAIRRYSIALKHLIDGPSTLPGMTDRIHWDLSSVYMALADELLNEKDDEETDRIILKHLTDSGNEAAESSSVEANIRDADINFRQGKVRKRMLLRLLTRGSDAKICANYMRLGEKSLEKSIASYASLGRWKEWASGHSEMADLLANPLLTQHSIVNRKTMIAKTSYQLQSIGTVMVECKRNGSSQCQALTEEALGDIFCALSKLLILVEDHCPKLKGKAGQLRVRFNSTVESRKYDKATVFRMFQQVVTIAQKMK